jgi:predicted amidophosphoribosyltransferase
MRGTGVELGRLLGKDFLDRSVPQLGSLNVFKNPVLIPIPLHKKKLRKRGFNQSEAIAEGIGRETDWPVISDSAKRIKRTTTQTGLNAAQRSANLKGAFSIRAELLPDRATPMIVDDVFTTGTTTFELSSALEKAGFSPSVIITVARA